MKNHLIPFPAVDYIIYYVKSQTGMNARNVLPKPPNVYVGRRYSICR